MQWVVNCKIVHKLRTELWNHVAKGIWGPDQLSANPVLSHTTKNSCQAVWHMQSALFWCSASDLGLHLRQEVLTLCQALCKRTLLQRFWCVSGYCLCIIWITPAERNCPWAISPSASLLWLKYYASHYLKCHGPNFVTQTAIFFASGFPSVCWYWLLWSAIGKQTEARRS